MKYSKIQKFISSFVIFSLLFGITFRLPFFDFSTYAKSSDFFNLVSIIVDEDSYNKIESELKRYAEDIQGVLENTKVVILPTPKNTDAFNIASLNESLYYEGYKSIDDTVNFESKLVGTVLVGDFNLPVVYNNSESSKTILPFTDFDDKIYIYNQANKRYEKNSKGSGTIKSEIWHGVISPNLGNFDKNIAGLKDYFNKNHDYYSGTGNFKLSDGIINGDKNTGVSAAYEPYVFYNDQFREEKSLSYNNYKAYEGYLENMEDIVYNRFSSDLANKLSDSTIGNANNEILERAKNIVKLNKELGDTSPFKEFDEKFVSSLVSALPETENVPDIQTRLIIENVTKQFVEIFSKGTMGEFRKNVNNAGRYSKGGSDVNADFVPYLISILDVVYGEMIKDVNNDLETEIDNLVASGLSRNIAIPTKIVTNVKCGKTYENYLFGRKGEDVKTAADCSIYRGSTENGGKLVEANRGLNINLIEEDKKKLDEANICYQKFSTGESFNGWWGGNSPLNLKVDGSIAGMMELKNRDLKGAIVPLFDIGGAKEISDSTKIPSPLNCFDNNLILAEENDYRSHGFGESVCENIYRLPTFGNRQSWSCVNDNNSGRLYSNNSIKFEDIYKNLSGGSCEYNHLFLDGTTLKSEESTDECGGSSNGTDYYFKKIPSYVLHKSPTEEEIMAQIKATVTPSLPVDKDRYIDFISPIGELIKIKYPSLFRINDSNKEKITFETISLELDKVLNEKSREINDIMNKNNPNNLTGVNLEIFNLLKAGAYPTNGIDLLKTLKETQNSTLNAISGTRKMTNYDTLVFSLYWNSLNTVSAKYAFVFEYFLNDQSDSETQKYFLPKSKNQYEIAYIGAKGDAKNMYIKMDPEAKADNVYSSIISKNMELSSSLLASNIGKSGYLDDEGETFDCAPPDGVPIWEWIPAVMCRLGEMLPPTISFSDGMCGSSLLGMMDDEYYSDEEMYTEEGETSTCNGDSDKNGINDCVEQNLLDGGVLELNSDSEKYYYNTNAILNAVIKDKNGKIVNSANNTYVYFELDKIEEAKDKTKEFDDSNIKVVYDKNDENNSNKSIISNYINFKETKIRSKGGVSNYMISSKLKEVNVFLRAYIKIDDNSGKEVIFLDSKPLEIQVRGNKLFNSTYKLDKGAQDNPSLNAGINSLKVSDKNNIFLVDGTNKDINNISKAITSSSTSPEKLALFVKNVSTTGKNIPLSYPLSVTLFEGKNEIDKQNITKEDLNLFKAIFSIKKSGSYTIKIKDSEGYTTTKNIELLAEAPNYVDVKLGTSVMQTGGNVTTNFISIYDKYSNLTSGEYYNIDFDIDGSGVEFLDNNSDKLKTSTFEGYKIFRLKSTSKDGDNKINVEISDTDGKNLLKTSKSIKVLDNINLSVKPLSGDIKVGGGTYKYELSLRDENGKIIEDFNSRAYLIADPIFLKTKNPYVEVKNGLAEIEFTTKTTAGKNIPIEFQVEGLTKIAKKTVNIYPDKPMKIDLFLSQNEIEASETSSSTLNVELKDRYNNVVFNDDSTKTTLEILEQYSHIIKSDKSSSIVKEGKTSYKIMGTLNPGVAHFKVSTNPGLENNSFVSQDENGKVTVYGVSENTGKIETFYFWNKSKIEGKKYNSIYTTLLGTNYGDITEQDYLAGSLLFEKDNRSLAVTSLLSKPTSYSNILKLDKSGSLKTIHSEQDLTQDIEINTKFINNKLALDIYNKSLNIYLGDIFYNFDDNTKLIACETSTAECIDKKETSINLKSFSDNYNVYLDNDKLILRDISGKNLLEIDEDGTINRFGSIDFEFDKSNKNDYLLINIKTGGQIIAKLNFNFIGAGTNVSRDENIFNSKVDSVKNSILVLVKTNSYGTYDSGSTNNKSKIFYYNDPFGSENALNAFTKNNMYGYENFVNKGGLGWEESNKSLLAFSAGKTVGESVQDYMSFSVINLGDPVISLKNLKNKLPGTVTDKKFDATIGKLLSKDTNITGYQVFDYNNDSLDDILLVKKDKYLKLLENKNVEGRFIDKGNLAYLVDLGDTDSIGTGDFTGDGFDDVFFVNKDGDPYLLNNVDKDFTRYSLIEKFDLDGKILAAKVFDMDNDGKDDIVVLDDYGEINIFYGGGTKAKPDFTKLTLSENNGVTLSSDITNNNSLVYFNGLHQPSAEQSNTSRIDNLLYIKYPYTKTNSNIDYQKVVDGETKIEDEKPSIYFLKSEYAQGVGLKVEKSFKDVNGGFISSSDIVDAKIVLTNVSNTKLSNLIFSEKLPEVFTLSENSIKSDKKVDIKDGVVGYQFLIDGFSLNPNESITITYKAKVKPIKHSYIDVGLFEKGEIGDDKYGDVIIKKDNQNCGENVDIFRSLENISSRSYEKGIKTPTCDESKIKLPNDLDKNSKDEDGNGVPDYIDELTNDGDLSALKEYGQEELDKLNSDTGDVGSVMDEISDGLDSVNEYLLGLSCGFGGAGCMSLPLNWAPLAPGSDPVFMGRLIGDGLMVGEGMPVFSLLTGYQTMCGKAPCCLPSIWPVTSRAYVPGPLCGPNSAGGELGIWAPTNTLRIFVTPTLTGGVGTAICFGGPAAVVGNSVPQGLSPLAPGGNCVVLAKNFDWCGGDGSDGDPGSVGVPIYVGNESASFGVINGNCSTDENSDLKLSQEHAGKYLADVDNWVASNDLYDFTENMFYDTYNDSLFEDSNGFKASVNINPSALNEGNFEDIVEIQQERISSFPSWLMDWVTRQIEEIANKLTDFPTIFIILPDFSGIFDGDWGKTSGNDMMSDYDPVYLDNNLIKNETISSSVKKVNSGIKEAYEFIGSIPLVYIEQETVNITIPWISSIELNKTISSREATVKQRRDEVDRAKNAWSYGKACNEKTQAKQEQCENDNAVQNKFSIDLIDNVENLIESINDNLEILNEYKKLPEQISKLISKKQDYLEQILCNIESISYILGGRIGKNGERFEAWVKTYILIKAILKSWQGLIDVFTGYEEECHECKNERQDALETEFSLISFIMPKVPIIKFPKWPDIILDLHNIRAGLRVPLPEFDINTRPLLLPTLPSLFLPDTPNINLSVQLPEIPLLPSIEIPELPDLPSLPTVELPDLPPPPKLPKILGEIEIVVDIIKLISKAMCILKSSPLHPEWRAGDQIAFLTERGGYLPTDFIDLSIPDFSFPFVDAIKVTTYVNLEFETEFIVELARQIAAPLNNFTNDFSNIFDIGIGDLDFEDATPGYIGIEAEVGLNKTNSLEKVFASRVTSDIQHLSSVIEKGKNDEVNNEEFKKLVNKSLSSESITSNPKLDKIRQIWVDVDNLTYSKEKSLVKELQKSNTEKFQALKDIINTEIISNKQLNEKINNVGKGQNITKVAYNKEDKITLYNETLSKYNDKFKESANKLINQKLDDNQDLKESRDQLLSAIKTPLQKYSQGVSVKTDEKLLAESNEKNEKLLADTTTSTNTVAGVTSCQAQANSDSDYKYKYEGIYILENDTSYRLFNYLDELDGEETTKVIDVDNDSDDDLLYFVKGQLFLKENGQNKPSKTYLATNPLVLTADDNKFYNKQVFHEAVNNAHEAGTPNGKINLFFSSPTDKTINNFRIGFYSIVDKYLNEGNENYRPEYINKEIIDAVAGIDKVTKTEESDLFIKRKNLVYIDNVGNLKDVKLKTKEIIDISANLSKNQVVNITKGTSLYAGGNSFKISYIEENNTEVKTLSISSNNNIELKKNIKIVGINGNAYIEGSNDIVYNGMEIINHLNKPLFPGAKITYSGTENNSSNHPYIELKYYDDSELNMDFDITKSWELIDLGNTTNDYFVSTNRENDFYYAKINSFKNNINSTLSNQILLAPQKESDQIPPELSLNSIRIPVYQKQVKDLTSYIYEYGGIKNVKDVIVDFDLEKDTDGNGNTKDDNDGELDGIYKDKIKILKSLISLKIEFGEFDTLFKKKIGITLVDSNNNVGYKEVSFEVYTPIPKITNYKDGVIIGSINESLTNEPVNLYRYRAGGLLKLKDTEGSTKAQTDKGNYTFKVDVSGKGLILTKDGKEIALIDDKTGKIALKDLTLSSKVLSSNDERNDKPFPKILIQGNGENIFYEYIEVKGINKVKTVENFDEITEKGIYFTLTDRVNYNYYTIPETLDYGPGAVSVYNSNDADKSPLFTIFKDGRINTINRNYRLEYINNDKYVIFKIIDTNNKEIGRVLFLINGEYIMN